MRKVWIGFALSAVLLALGIPASAQQAGKIFRIGFLDPSNASGIAVLVEAFRQELGKLGWIKEKTSPSSIGLEITKALRTCLSLRRTWSVLRSI
jgi:hypothetical protein